MVNKQKKADIVLISNAVFTGLESNPEPKAIAIVNNKIAAVGSKEELQSLIGEETKVLDYGDKLIMPGFHDFHLHAMMGSLALECVNLFEARSEEEAVEMVQQYAEQHPDEPWVIGFMWDSSYWEDKGLPSRFSLDRVFPDRPVVLFHAEGHYSWVNSKALEMANIDKDTKNPSYGTIEKDDNGEPTGILIEEASSLVTEYAYDLPKGKKASLFRNFLKEAASYGVTSVNNLYGTETLSKLDDFELFQEFEENAQLTVRMHLFPQLDGDIDYAKQLREKYQSAKLRVAGLKQFIDGVVTSRTAYMLQPYADQPDTCGHAAFPSDQLKDWVVAADKEEFSIRFHAIGDEAIRLALDVFEEAQKINGARDSRHAIEHIEVINRDDVSRFASLGVIASMQPDHMALSERGVYTERIGKEREKDVFIINTLQKSGAQLALGTDFPIDSLNPMLQIYRAVSRIDSGGKDVWSPDERITVSEALRAYTYGSAFGTFRDHELGTLEAGKLADIAVLDRNIFDVPVEEILDTKVEMTISDGKIIYSKQEQPSFS
ncbi:amidohydrolase [Pseudobacillus wudalianchiensis]|uniref:Amidohydrolase n=1 Tax=Pseudobacillus wudalianchiensis TaxID=1743143 RepID=A0A1B9AZE9_9BACI|nr:amidohydrolase [Bacillus wudalianchiensis]OCA89118.1 amidohydrolase [Bacillus wudalianchiensis]